MTKLFSSAFIRFIIVGVINTVNYYIMYLLLLNIAPYMVSHVSAFLWSFICSYYLNCYFVYHVKPKISTFLKFPLTQIINMGLQTVLLMLFVKMRLDERLAPFPALIITVPVTYLIAKYIFVEGEYEK
ncbi:GtrA family protein [Macrococcus hajekii]|uniref:GtrA family protein n=1 Tax=Macrococcus hajekii TaxID=198482 RepID=A0A4R6BMX3_9STAP|nr:GtrA family protein [Macrococcus hajekii]TDM03193.1 GtrA family protein [Macrococcus hajekii]GGA96776.1 GtrA-like protein [Macrococcus hajekii]